jgi:uncharacterized protein YndB with AHSA1/START domain
MTTSPLWQPDPRLDLVLERDIDVPVKLVWAAYTQPEHLKNWFTPKPWTIPECEVDLQPGGRFRVVMRSPEGEESNILGCYLEVEPERRLVWTDALLPGYRPSGTPFMTAIISMEPKGSGSHYTAMARHADEATRERHQEMGFYDGWGTVLDQLIEYSKTML